MRTVINCKVDVPSFIEHTQLPKLLIQHYLKRATITAVFWGQLHLISDAIDPYVDKSKYTDWDAVVAQSNIKVHNLIKDQVENIDDDSQVNTGHSL